MSFKRTIYTYKSLSQVWFRRIYRASGFQWRSGVVLHDSWWCVFSAIEPRPFKARNKTRINYHGCCHQAGRRTDRPSAKASDRRAMSIHDFAFRILSYLSGARIAGWSDCLFSIVPLSSGRWDRQVGLHCSLDEQAVPLVNAIRPWVQASTRG